MQMFCRQVWPLLRERRPKLKLQIVGANPSKNILMLGELPGVTETGSVPDVRPFVVCSALTVAPLNIARGTQNKILESLSMGIPVVSSPEAAKGIDAIPGQHLLVAASPEEYRDAILALLSNPGERERLSNAGRRRILTNHDWANSMHVFDSLLERCLALAGQKTRVGGGPVSVGG